MTLKLFARRTLFLALKAGFRLTPLSSAARDRLRQRFLGQYMALAPAGPIGRVDAGTIGERRAHVHAAGRAIGYLPRQRRPWSTPPAATLIAFYLPQFHAIPENDAWWGGGFTEWNNVTRALPQFEGHAQPRLPGDLGFYDLRQPDALRKQMQLAQDYGIGAFCSYFYWFGGKRLLDAPLENWLSDPGLTLPICLCWANENWSRRWDGREDDILMAQQHSAEDDLAFIEHVARFLRDPRYLRVDGKPLLLVYRPGLLPDAAATAARWRQWCRAHGLGEIHLAYVQSFDRVVPSVIGFDTAIEFPPNNLEHLPVTADQRLLNPDYRGDVFDWRALAGAMTSQRDPGYPLIPCVTPGWDNEPRRSGRGRTFIHASPRGYRDWLRSAIAAARRRQPNALSPLVFVNAWNEWAEGAVLEPDTRLGHAWLDATRTALLPPPPGDPLARPCAVVHVWYVELLEEIAIALRGSGVAWRWIITTAFEQEKAVRARVAELGLDAEIVAFENRGRDILPFLHVANRLLDEGVDVVLKLHTKRSTHRSDGDQWRADLFTKLLGSDRAPQILEAFRQQPKLGLVCAEGHLQPLGYYWGANRANVDYLATRVGIAAPQIERDVFVAGSMLWLRLASLRPLLDAGLGELEFENESAQLDGTLAHAVERLVALTAASAGFSTISAAVACGIDVPPAVDYPYARRSR